MYVEDPSRRCIVFDFIWDINNNIYNNTYNIYDVIEKDIWYYAVLWCKSTHNERL